MGAFPIKKEMRVDSTRMGVATGRCSCWCGYGPRAGMERGQGQTMGAGRGRGDPKRMRDASELDEDGGGRGRLQSLAHTYRNGIRRK